MTLFDPNLAVETISSYGNSFPPLARAVALLITASACFAASLRGASKHLGRSWLLIACILLVLGIAAGLQLDRVILTALRQYFRTHGWYARRSSLQVAALIGGAMLAGVSLLIAGRFRRRLRRRIWWPALSVGLLLATEAVRLISLHRTDVLLQYRLGLVKVGWLMEAIPLGVILSCAASVWYRSVPGLEGCLADCDADAERPRHCESA